VEVLHHYNALSLLVNHVHFSKYKQIGEKYKLKLYSYSYEKKKKPPAKSRSNIAVIESTDPRNLTRGCKIACGYVNERVSVWDLVHDNSYK
jgi:hypothetical protein